MPCELPCDDLSHSLSSSFAESYLDTDPVAHLPIRDSSNRSLAIGAPVFQVSSGATGFTSFTGFLQSSTKSTPPSSTTPSRSVSESLYDDDNDDGGGTCPVSKSALGCDRLVVIVWFGPRALGFRS